MTMGARKMAKFGAAALIGTLLTGFPLTPVHGQASTQPVTVTAHLAPLTERVPFDDLTLATKDGQRTLYLRVRYAVDSVCPESDPEGAYDILGCKMFAWSGARPQMNRAVTAARAGAPLTMAIVVTSAFAK
jgi:UrcA family protein